MCRRAQGTVRRKAVCPGVLGPKEATLEVDPRRPRHGPSQPQGGPGAPRTSRRSQDHADSDARRSGSPVRRRSMENPPLLHEQDTLGWAVPGRIRIRSRGFRPEVDGADFFFYPLFVSRVTFGNVSHSVNLGFQSKMTVRLPRTNTRSSICRRSPRAKASRSHNLPLRRRSAGVSRCEMRNTS